jgi:hypothetical protein
MLLHPMRQLRMTSPLSRRRSPRSAICWPDEQATATMLWSNKAKDDRNAGAIEASRACSNNTGKVKDLGATRSEDAGRNESAQL